MDRKAHEESLTIGFSLTLLRRDGGVGTGLLLK